MHWPTPSLEGFALAATVAHDGDAALAAAGLSPALRERLCALPRALAEAPKHDRRAHIRRIALSFAQARPRLPGVRWPG